MSVQGPIPVEFGTVFPSGAYAAGAFDPGRNFDASTGEKFAQSADRATGAPLWVIEVIDPDPAARTRAVKVKVAAPVQPVVPTGPPGSPFVPVALAPAWSRGRAGSADWRRSASSRKPPARASAKRL